MLCKLRLLTTNTVMLLTPTESHKLPVLLLSRASCTSQLLQQFWDYSIHTIVKQYLHRKTNSQGTFSVKGFMALFIIVAVLGLQYSHDY